MLSFKLIKREGDIYHYEVYPNGDVEDKGDIVFNVKTGENIKRVEPKKRWWPSGWIHFFRAASDGHGGFRESGRIGWY